MNRAFTLALAAAVLLVAVARGEVALSVRDIRRFLSCSQARASELRRQLVTVA